LRITPANTLPPSATATSTNTALPTYTPSVTATPISCSGITGVAHGPLVIEKNVAQMSINNQTGHTLSTARVYLEWNHDTGHDGADRSLRLRQILFGGDGWSGDIHVPSAYINAYYPRIPMGESVIQFVFHQSYDFPDGTERVIITISNPGCLNYPVDSSH